MLISAVNLISIRGDLLRSSKNILKYFMGTNVLNHDDDPDQSFRCLGSFQKQDLELPSRFEAGAKNKRHAKLKHLTCHSIGKEVYLWQSKTV